MALTLNEAIRRTVARALCACGCGQPTQPRGIGRPPKYAPGHRHDAFRAARIDAGLCIDCGRPAREGVLRCAVCSPAPAARPCTYQGGCASSCGPRERYCAPHRAAATLAVKAKSEKAKREERRQLGLCGRCSRKAAKGRRYCRRHLADAQAAKARSAEKRRR